MKKGWLSRKLDDKALLASALISVGAEFLLQGDHERGAMLNEEAAELYREQGNIGHLQYALDNLGWAALMRGEPTAGRSPAPRKPRAEQAAW
jgi:hypothetical protein